MLSFGRIRVGIDATSCRRRLLCDEGSGPGCRSTISATGGGIGFLTHIRARSCTGTVPRNGIRSGEEDDLMSIQRNYGTGVFGISLGGVDYGSC
jgi:hypothetical protein